MSCHCETYSCLTALYDPCSEGAQLDIVATETGEWSAQIAFNGRWTIFSFDVTDGDKIIIPTSVLNENYVHEFRLYDTAGLLVACYHLNANAVAGAGEFTPTTGSGEYLIFDVTASQDGADLNDERFTLGEVLTAVTGGQAYNGQDFTQAGETITFNVLALIEGQVVTITLKKS